MCLQSILGAPQLRAYPTGGGGGGGGSDADKNAVITSQQLEVNFDGNYVSKYDFKFLHIYCIYKIRVTIVTI